MATVHRERTAVEVELLDLFDPSPEDASWYAALCDSPDAPSAFAEPTLPFGEWVSAQASYFRSLGSAAGYWLAAMLEEKADLARMLGVQCPDELDDRTRVLDDSRDDAIFRRGVARGLSEAGLNPRDFDLEAYCHLS